MKNFRNTIFSFFMKIFYREKLFDILKKKKQIILMFDLNQYYFATKYRKIFDWGKKKNVCEFKMTFKFEYRNIFQ